VWLGGITRLIDERAAPGEDGVGLGNCRDLCEGFLAQLLTKRSEDSTILIGRRHATGDLLAQKAILGDQVRMTQPECFVNRRGDRPEQFLPVHPSLTPAKTSSIADQYGRKREEIQAEARLMVEA
jgi:hypothetical protein